MAMFIVYWLAGLNLSNQRSSLSAKAVYAGIVAFLVLGIDETLVGADFLLALLALASILNMKRDSTKCFIR